MPLYTQNIPEFIPSFNNGYRWINNNGIHFKGFFCNQYGKYYEGSHAIQQIQAVENTNELVGMLQNVHGSFTIIINTSEQTIIAIDQMSQFPVFYTHTDNRWLISDSVSELLKHKANWHINREAIPEFLSAGFVMGNETLIEDIYRVKPGAIICLSNASHDENKSHIHATEWHNFLPQAYSLSNTSTPEEDFLSILDRITAKLLNSLHGRTLVLPLSGGYDSRLIACMLRKAGVKDVICFSYGRPNPESALSEEVAKRLGYKWLFTDYSLMDTSGYIDDPLFHDYCQYAGNHTSMPYLQEYFAVKYMKDKQLIPDNSTFLPGHSGDFLGGSYVDIAARYSGKEQNLPSHIASIYFPFLPLTRSERNIIEARLKKWLEAHPTPASQVEEGYAPIVEDWDVKEKLAKFIFNSSSVFPYFGYELRFPLWDAEMQTFFRKLPYKLRSNKFLYDKTLEDRIFKPMNVYFGDEELKPSGRPPKAKGHMSCGPQIIADKAKQWTKRIMPFFLLEKLLRKNDWICYQQFTKEMVKEMNKDGCDVPKRFNRYNALICQWYLCNIKKKRSTLNPKPKPKPQP